MTDRYLLEAMREVDELTPACPPIYTGVFCGDCYDPWPGGDSSWVCGCGKAWIVFSYARKPDRPHMTRGDS